jgi:sugar phosphate isomerase/epimerase
MNTTATRRTFLKHSLGAGLAMASWGVIRPSAAVAGEPFKRSGSARLYVSMAAYSFRDYFNHKDPAKRITMFDFLDYCADHGCDGAEVTSYYFPKELTTDYLIQVRRHAFLRGLVLSGTSVGNNFVVPKGEKLNQQIALVKEWVDRAAILGAPHVRVFAGDARDIPRAEAKATSIAALEECAEYAGRKGVFLGLENHGGIVAEPKDFLELVQAVKSPWFGVNLDLGNFNTDDPYSDLALCAPYAVNVHFKSELNRRGKGKEQADLTRLVKILRDANYQGYAALEYENEPDPYQAVPGILKRMRELFA